MENITMVSFKLLLQIQTLKKKYFVPRHRVAAWPHFVTAWWPYMANGQDDMLKGVTSLLFVWKQMFAQMSLGNEHNSNQPNLLVLRICILSSCFSFLIYFYFNRANNEEVVRSCLMCILGSTSGKINLFIFFQSGCFHPLRS